MTDLKNNQATRARDKSSQQKRKASSRKEPKTARAMQEYRVESFAEFTQVLQDIGVYDDEPGVIFLFRGMPNADWEITSTAALRLEKEAAPVMKGAQQVDELGFETSDNNDEETYNNWLIEQWKHQGFYQDASATAKTNLGILAEIRHYGGATSLIDFTTDPYVAFWFAGQRGGAGSGVVAGANADTDGVVYALKITDNDKFVEIFSEEQLQQLSISEILNTHRDKWFYWKPMELNKRIPAQKSCFVIGRKSLAQEARECLIKITIAKKVKPDALPMFMLIAAMQMPAWTTMQQH